MIPRKPADSHARKYPFMVIGGQSVIIRRGPKLQDYLELGWKNIGTLKQKIPFTATLGLFHS
jgi:hypothetical protein